MRFALHGFTGAPAMWNSLAACNPTLLGHGPAAVATGTENFEQEVTRLLTLLPTQPLHLIGYSLGARLSLSMALRCPARIAKLSLIGCNPGISNRHEREARRQSDWNWCETLREKGIEAFVSAWEGLPLWESQRSLPLHILHGQRRMRIAHDSEQLALSLEALGTGSMPPMWLDLHKLRMPVQVIVGQFDSKYIEIGTQLCSLLERASLHTIAGAGHNPVLEAPLVVERVLNLTS